MSTPFVSVIVPNYCHAQFLDERINSILSQTYENYEIIILDDCSPDNGASKFVIEKYRKNSHVSQIVYNEVNTGSPFVQWEKGLELAKGEIVWIAESDDSCKSTFLEELLDSYLKSDAVLAFCRSIRMDEKSRTFETFGMQDKLKHSFVMDGAEFNGKYMSVVNSVMNASSAIFSRKAALRLNKQYMFFKGSGDWLFWIEIAENGKVCFLDRNLNFFRKHGTNTTERTIREGSNILENKRVFDYLVDRKMVNRRQIIRRKLFSIEFIRNSFPHLDEGKRKEYLAQWGYTGFFIPVFHVLYLFKRIKRRLDRINNK